MQFFDYESSGVQSNEGVVPTGDVLKELPKTWCYSQKAAWVHVPLQRWRVGRSAVAEESIRCSSDGRKVAFDVIKTLNKR